MAKVVNFHVKGLTLKAVLVDKIIEEINVFSNTLTHTYILYCQNRLVKRVKYYQVYPEGATSLRDIDTTVLVDYCVIPEFDELLK